MTIFGLDEKLLYIVIAALVFGAIFFRIGFRNPGYKDSYRWRQIWALADIFAVLLTIVGVAKLMSPILSLQEAQRDSTKRFIAVTKQESLIAAVNRAQDRYCPVTGIRQYEANTCDVLRKVQRSLYAPRVNYITAAGILETDLPVICTKKTCDPLIEEIRQLVLDFQKYSLEIRDIVDNPHPTTEKDIILVLIFTGFYIFVGSFRLGRSGAEYARNKLDYEAQKVNSRVPMWQEAEGQV